ncbi:hypothetical protein [Streptomyces sp. NBC_00829]|uniref:hypothetical protein n=1 Tax=Streptomyces sp. NBC_00829 TaxID=2903679 RepID=UPI00386B1B1B|nr:hypothetical protein OG293_36810 [Streptomyces sp. NBC_00829]
MNQWVVLRNNSEALPVLDRSHQTVETGEVARTRRTDHHLDGSLLIPTATNLADIDLAAYPDAPWIILPSMPRAVGTTPPF